MVEQESLVVNMKTRQTKLLANLGFNVGKNGAHTARTMMLEELTQLLAHVETPGATKSEYIQAIDQENCLNKRSQKTRKLTYRHIVELYSLDQNIPLFRALLYFWRRDESARPLLAMLCAVARDPILQSTSPYVLEFAEGAPVSREGLENHIDSIQPDRFSKATLKSTAQNINSSWTQSGHLIGRAKKIRAQAKATAGSVAYALFLSYLSGARGEYLFQSDYAKILDCSFERILELAEEAARRGWLILKRVSNVIEVSFPNLIQPSELESPYEQN